MKKADFGLVYNLTFIDATCFAIRIVGNYCKVKHRLTKPDVVIYY